MPKRVKLLCACLLLLAVNVPSQQAQSSRTPQHRPNVVFMFADNLGWGEVGVYGSVRGVPTPRIDRLAAEGIRLNNFNVEYSCRCLAPPG